jgi:hypothetical protein
MTAPAAPTTTGCGAAPVRDQLGRALRFDGRNDYVHVPEIHDVSRELSLELPEDQGYATIAGLCLHLAARIPEPGARFTTDDGTVIEVIEASPRRVRLVRVHPPPPAPADAAEEATEPQEP